MRLTGFTGIAGARNRLLAPDANVIGKVRIGSGVSIWFGTTIRGDNEFIVIGPNSNIQENCVLHTDYGFPLSIGTGCTIGHLVMLHGCTIGSNSLIGMHATVLNGANIGNNCLIGAGALVTEGTSIPDGSLALGAPAKVSRKLRPEEIDGLKSAAEHYIANIARYRNGLERLDAN